MKLLSDQTSRNLVNGRKVDVNLRSVEASAGSGLAELTTFCSTMNFPSPIYPTKFNNYIKHIASIADENCQESMNEAARKVRKLDRCQSAWMGRGKIDMATIHYWGFIYRLCNQKQNMSGLQEKPKCIRILEKGT